MASKPTKKRKTPDSETVLPVAKRGKLPSKLKSANSTNSQNENLQIPHLESDQINELSPTSRLKGISIYRPIVYGSIAFWCGKNVDEKKTHKWTCYIRGVENEDLSYFIKKVVFTLHHTFENPVRVLEEPPYEVTEIGWGEFDIKIEIFFRHENESSEDGKVEVWTHLTLFDESQQQTKKPVVKETYTEILFRNPIVDLYKCIVLGPHGFHNESPLQKHWNVVDFAEKEQETVRLIAAAHEKVLMELRRLEYQHRALTKINNHHMNQSNSLSLTPTTPMSPMKSVPNMSGLTWVPNSQYPTNVTPVFPTNQLSNSQQRAKTPTKITKANTK